LELDSTDLIELLVSEQYMAKFGLAPNEALILFIPNTYQFFWNTSAEQFIDRMYKEYHAFWNEERLQLSAYLGLTPFQVMV